MVQLSLKKKKKKKKPPYLMVWGSQTTLIDLSGGSLKTFS